jgi:TfoX/Sxy family transcriptional regulator of competence genes
MPYNEELAARVRYALAHRTDVNEKKMFGGIAFMVDGKMCIVVGKGRLMCRIDPAIQADAIMNEGVETMKMKGRDLKGYINIDEDVVKGAKELDHWIALALDYNKVAKASRK